MSNAFAAMNGLYLEDLKPGMSAAFAKTVTEADICMFAGVSGDTNPVHLNQEFAAATPFGGRIAHGILTASFVSAVIGTKLPGPGCIYVSQSLRFKAPVKAGDTVTATVTVRDIVAEKKRVVLDTVCTVAGKAVLDGEAVVLVSRRG